MAAGEVPDSSCTTVGALTHWPGVAEHVTADFARPATAGSERMAPVAAEGPAFVTRIV